MTIEEKLNFFDISSIFEYLIAILIGIFIGVFLPAWYQNYLVKKREKGAFLKKLKADLELCKKYWIDYFKKRETKNVKKRETTTILTADREGTTSIRDSFFCYISSRFLFSIFLLTELLALKISAFLGLISRALS